MTEVSFYILASSSQQERYLFACKLIEKAYRGGHFCYVLTDSDEESRQIDDLLWTFRVGSFVPHQCYQGVLPDIEDVVLIGSSAPPESWRKILINLSSRCPDHFEQIERVLEILDGSENIKAAGRERYRRYQKAALEITTHKV